VQTSWLLKAGSPHLEPPGLLLFGKQQYPWENARSARKYTQAPPTEFYSVEQAVAIIEAFKGDHPDWSALIDPTEEI
jgi:hypothetical protein